MSDCRWPCCSVRQRFAVTGFDIDEHKVSALNSGGSYIVRILPKEIQSAQKSGFRATSDYRPDRPYGRRHHLRSDPAERVSRTRPELHYEHHRGDCATPARRPVDRAGKHDLSGNHRGSRHSPPGKGQPCGFESDPRGLAGKFLCRVLSRARRSGQYHGGAPRHPKGCRGRGAHGNGACLRLVRDYLQSHRAGLQPGGGRADQASGKYLPLRKHRLGQRDEAALPAHGHRSFRGHRGGQNQALRIPGFLSGPGIGRTLHSDRSFLLVVEGKAVRLPHQVYRTGRRSEHWHALLRGRGGRCRSQ